MGEDERRAALADLVLMLNGLREGVDFARYFFCACERR